MDRHQRRWRNGQRGAAGRVLLGGVGIAVVAACLLAMGYVTAAHQPPTDPQARPSAGASGMAAGAPAEPASAQDAAPRSVEPSFHSDAKLDGVAAEDDPSARAVAAY
jgi:hypothetical protein